MESKAGADTEVIRLHLRQDPKYFCQVKWMLEHFAIFEVNKPDSKAKAYHLVDKTLLEASDDSECKVLCGGIADSYKPVTGHHSPAKLRDFRQGIRTEPSPGRQLCLDCKNEALKRGQPVIGHGAVIVGISLCVLEWTSVQPTIRPVCKWWSLLRKALQVQAKHGLRFNDWSRLRPSLRLKFY
jgi:hypothetical protein